MNRVLPDDAAARLVPAGGHVGQRLPLVRLPEVHVALVVLVADPGDEDTVGVDAGDAVVVLAICWDSRQGRINTLSLNDIAHYKHEFQNNSWYPFIPDLPGEALSLLSELRGTPHPCLELERDPETLPHPS